MVLVVLVLVVVLVDKMNKSNWLKRAQDKGLVSKSLGTRLPIAIQAPMGEREFQDCVIAYAQSHGWKVAHFRPSRVKRKGKETWETPFIANARGYPDLTLVRERVVWIELKSEKGKLTDDQTRWLVWLSDAGQECHWFRPSDWAKIQEILK